MAPKIFFIVGIYIIYVLSEASAFCVINNNCTLHGELLNRKDPSYWNWFSGGFSKTLNHNDKVCCDPSNKGCQMGSREDTLLWIDRDKL